MRKLSSKQAMIVKFIGNDTYKKSEITAKFKHWYFHNADFHIGQVLSRLVNRKVLEKPKRGYYKKRGKPVVEDPNQLTLF